MLRVQACPYCGAAHVYIVELTLRSVPGTTASIVRTDVTVACSVDGRTYRTQSDIAISAGQAFVTAQFARYG